MTFMDNLRLMLPEMLIFTLGAVWALGCTSDIVTAPLVAALVVSVISAGQELFRRYQRYTRQGRRDYRRHA